MKQKIFLALAIIYVSALSLSANAQGKNVNLKESAKTMTWTTKSAAAKEHAMKGMNYLMNIEMPQAYDHFSSALKLDPDFTAALVILSNLSYGETRKMYAAKALKSAGNKTPGEKQFASLVDEKGTAETRRETWSKLHDMFPDDKMVGTYYVFTRATADERFAAAQDFIKRFPEEASMYNIMGYYYLNDKKDNAEAKRNFEKYIELYPKGYNPFDSMAEFYLTTGDTSNAEKYYTMALEKYPFSNSSINALDKIESAKPKKDMKTEEKKAE
jgi:Tfp pilus assembly protein PilF